MGDEEESMGRERGGDGLLPGTDMLVHDEFGYEHRGSRHIHTKHVDYLIGS